MPITTKYYVGFPGMFIVQDPALTNVVVLHVCRAGKGHEVVVGAGPGNREARYSDGEGKLTFVNAFPGDPTNDVGRETVYVRYRY